MRKPLLQAAAGLLAFVLANAESAPAPGDVDPAFVYERPSETGPTSTNAVPLPNGYLVIRSRWGESSGGDSTVDLTMIDQDGRVVDQGFGTDGTYTNSVPGTVDLALATMRLADGTVLLGGHELKTGSTTDSMAAVARVDSTGRLDPAFGQAGVATFDVPGGRDRVASLAVLPDGRIAALVWSEDVVTHYDCSTDKVTLVYLSRDGGEVHQVFTQVRDSYAATSCRTTATLHVDPDGTVLVGTELGVFHGDGVSIGDPLLPRNWWRYGPFAKDATWGLVWTSINGQGVDLFNQPPIYGLVEAAGYGAPATWSKLLVDAPRGVVYVAFATDHGQVGVARFKVDGSLDTGWGHGYGVVPIAGSGSAADGWVAQGLATEARLLHVDAGGKLVVATADGIVQRLTGGATPSPGAFVLAEPPGPVPESSISVAVTVRRIGGSTGAGSVTVTAVACGSGPDRECPYWSAAQPGQDFQTSTQRLDWSDGDATDRTVSVQLLDDDLAEPLEVFFVEIADATDGFGVLTQRVPVFIDSDEKPHPNSTPTGPEHAGRGGSGRIGLSALLSLLTIALALCQRSRRTVNPIRRPSP